MNEVSLTKIEKRAINVLESIIDDHKTIDYHFNYADKEMSWDGYIFLPLNDAEEITKANFGGRIPVQIKGHEDYDRKYINKSTITYDVELDDIRAYATEKGVLYFQIFIDDKKGTVFYNSLFPSKIADILERAEQKGNQKTKRIPFVKMSSIPEKMAIVVKQFNEEAIKQGSAYNPLVIDRIRSDEFIKIKELSFTVFGAQNTVDALMRIPSGDICLYGKMEDDKYFRPIETLGTPSLTINGDVNEKISIDNEIFYDHFHNTINSNEGQIIIPSPNFKLHITQGTIDFDAVSSIAELYRDARFISQLKDGAELQIGDKICQLSNVRSAEGFDQQLAYIITLYEALVMIGFDVNLTYSSLSDEQKTQLAYLVDIKNGAHIDQNNSNYMKYLWQFGNKYYPLLIINKEQHIELCSAIYTDRFTICLPNNERAEEMGERMPLFAYQSVEVLSNLYYYDYDAFREQIDKCDVNNHSTGALLQFVLLMINVYDKCGDVHFLDLAEHLLDLIEQCEQSDLITLNRLQIKKRNSDLSTLDIDILNKIEDNDIRLCFGKNVLLGNKEKALQCFNQFSEKEKEEYIGFPIYTLLSQL